ncbi:hypothetical protein WDU94_007146 [Cyamophila willieti]
MYYYVIEPLFFVIFFGRAIAQFTTNNLILHKLCVGDDVNHYLGKMCPNEREAQEKTTVLNTYLFVTTNICFVIACTVGGVWSDLYKRIKPLLWIPVLGLLICSIVNITFVYFWSVPGIVVALFNGLMCLFGETNLLYAGGLAYVTENSPESLRTFRIGLLLGAYYVSTPIGRGLSGWLNVRYGFINCYIICIALYIPSLLIIAYCLSEKEDRRYSKYGSYYADDDEKRASMRRALELYNQIIVEEDIHGNYVGNAPSELTLEPIGDRRIVNMNNSAQTNDVKNNKVGNVNATEVPISVIAVISPNEARINTHELEQRNVTILNENEPTGVSNQKEDTASQIGDQTNISRHKVAFDDKGFQDAEWKQVPKPKFSKLKKNGDPLYYHAYAETKRPPLQINGDGTSQKQRPLLVLASMSFYDNWKALVRPRTEERTTIIMIMVLTSPFLVAPMIVENSVFPLFVRTKFQWSETTYGEFAAFKLSVILGGIAFTIGFLNKKLKVSDSLIGTLASCSDTLACLGYILVRESWQMFLVPIMDIFHGSAQICCSAVISKLMDDSERAKIFGIKMAMDSLVPVILYPIYNIVYKNTLAYFPEAFFFISAACSVPGILAFSYVWYLQRKALDTMITTKL